MYIPGRLDAHNEFATSTDLQKALWSTVRAGDRMVNRQHGSGIAGEWVELVTWPYEVTCTLVLPDDAGVRKAREVTFPAGTPYIGVVWEPDAYEDVKKGRLRGMSMEGLARRVEVDFG